MKKLVLIALLLISQICKPSTVSVTNLLDNGAGSLRNCIGVAADGDTINFTVRGTIQIDSPLVINRTLFIISPSDDSIEINASNQNRIMEITGGDTVFIFGILFSGGYSNSVSSGAIIWKTSSGHLILRSSTLFNSSSTYHGGGIVQDSGTTNIYRTYFHNLSADSSGGAIRSNGGIFFVYSSTFESDSSGLSGAAISNHGGSFTVVNSTFYANVATLDGGACEGDSINLVNCTVTSNTAFGNGGGIKSGNGFIINSIIYNNHAPAGPDFFGAFHSSGYNLIGDTTASGTLTSTDIFGSNPLLGPISTSNGGRTPVCPISAGSPCIDSGSCMNAPTADQRDSLRIGLPDIGAFEFGGTPFVPTITSNTLCHGDTIFFASDTIIAAGVYIQILTAASGCDSTVELTITTSTPDTAVTQSGVTLTASASATAYQWYDCNSSTIILNETSQSFTAISNGSYAVIVTQNGCIDTSYCTIISTVGIETLSGNNSVIVYPSVLNDVLNIKFPSVESGSIQLYSVTGELILEQQFSNSEHITIPVKDLVAGIYLLSVRSSKMSYQGKVIRE